MEKDYVNFLESCLNKYDTDSWNGDGLTILDTLGSLSEPVRKGYQRG